MQLSPEQLKRAQSCNSVDELMQLATDEGISITEQQAQQLISSNTNVDLSEEDLDTVAGGCDTTKKHTCYGCGEVFDDELKVYTYYKYPKYSDPIKIERYYCRKCKASLYQ